ncbi:MAG: hypothetical protein JSU70_10160 [Phycisphaerales bacterium]|nr:MAG: hypothetical protein JSU70_10160 [Phycisphaerales bacterium]
MSTLTKVLIVLMTVFSIFLCGIVVTYVANAQDFKRQYNDASGRLNAARQTERDAKKQLEENIKKTDAEKADFNTLISELKANVTALEAQLKEAERQQAALQQRVDSWTSITKEFYQTNDKQRQLLDDTLAELNRLQQEQIKQGRELKQTTATLIEKMAVVSELEQRNKRLLEEKTELQGKLDQLLRQYGQALAPARPVTPVRTIARPAQPLAREIGLRGTVTAVDMQNSLAEISLGEAHGVKEDMKFHVTRGDKFICYILILDVAPEKAVGILDLVQQPPKAGDLVSTNL